MPLLGKRQLEARLDAVAGSGEGMARAWADETADKMRERVPVVSGKTRASIRSSSSSDAGEVTGDAALFFIDAGTRAHTVTPKTADVLRFNSRAQPLFRPRAQLPRVAARPFRAQAAKEAADDKVSLDVVVGAWNGAA